MYVSLCMQTCLTLHFYARIAKQRYAKMVLNNAEYLDAQRRVRGKLTCSAWCHRLVFMLKASLNGWPFSSRQVPRKLIFNKVAYLHKLWRAWKIMATSNQFAILTLLILTLFFFKLILSYFAWEANLDQLLGQSQSQEFAAAASVFRSSNENNYRVCAANLWCFRAHTSTAVVMVLLTLLNLLFHCQT
jgi:hypothetical protein